MRACGQVIDNMIDYEGERDACMRSHLKLEDFAVKSPGCSLTPVKFRWDCNLCQEILRGRKIR